MNHEQASQLITKGLEQLGKALSEGRSDELQAYLAMMSRFHKYSFGNVMLILTQNPEATRVAGFGAWRDLGRSVKKGQKGIGILAPLVYKAKDDEEPDSGKEQDGKKKSLRGFKIVHVFDILQTDGDELMEFTALHGEPGSALTALEAVVAELDIELEYQPEFGRLGASTMGKITVEESLPAAERFAIVAHELGHELLHDEARRRECSKQVKETEAEAVAFVVCSAFGMDSSQRSADYISLYRGDEETLSQSLDGIQKVAAELIVQIEEQATGFAKAEPSVSATVSTAPVVKRDLVPVTAGEVAEELSDEDLVVGRADYQERKEARIERYEARAAKVRSDSNAAFERSKRISDQIPFGQPILVGHHSEGRHRRDLKRIESGFRKGVDLDSKATHYESRAASSENSNAISSDDPEAVIKLREKLTGLERSQEEMKATNAAWRKAKKPAPDDQAGWERVTALMEVTPVDVLGIRKEMARMESYRMGGQPYQAYALSNNNAEIRRVKQRIAEFRRQQDRVQTDTDHGVCRLVQNVDDNRVQLFFPGKPSEEIRALLKSQGFRWARSAGAWQRFFNDQGLRAANYVVSQLTTTKEEENVH